MMMDVLKGMEHVLSEHTAEALLWEHLGSLGDSQRMLDEVHFLESYDYAVYILG